MANIIPVTPKQEVEKYRDITVHYMFNPRTSLWGYKFSFTQEFEIEDEVRGLAKAKKEAHKRIDKIREP
jgi:cephalosporin hydroxylase